jgi:hypothetical protein
MKSINIPKLDSLIWGLITNSDLFIHRIVAEFQSNDSVIQVKNIENQIIATKKMLQGLETRRKNRIDLYETGGLGREDFDERETGYRNDKIAYETQMNDLMKKKKFLGNVTHQADKLIEFGQKVCAGVKLFTKEQKVILLKELIKNIVVDFDGDGNRHIISCYLNFEAIVAIPAELHLETDGTSNYEAPKYNKHTFSDKYNPRPHMLIEKCQKGKEGNWQDYFGTNCIATQTHPIWCDEATGMDG